MTYENVPLLIVLVLSVLGNNQSVAVASGVLLLIKLLGLDACLPTIENKGLNIGVTILTIAILAPLATGRVTSSHLVDAFKSPTGIVAICAGVFVAWAAGRGLLFINASPDMISALVLGTVAGVCFLNGVAIGPLVAGGLVSIIIVLFGAFK